MKCKTCDNKAVLESPNYCKEHFITYFEKKVKEAIKKYKLITKNDQLVVGVSGGKDSLTILYLLKKWKYEVHALAIDEGIEGYRKQTLEDMNAFCKKYDVPVTIISYKEAFTKTLDEALPILKEKPCTVCGTFRRYLLNKGARDLKGTKMVTGHNRDDEAQAIMMNFLRNNVSLLARQGPRSGIETSTLFVPRVKPLYFCGEKEVLLYSLLKGFKATYVECPNTPQAFRADVGRMLNALEEKHPGTKQHIIETFLSDLPQLREQFKGFHVQQCKECGEPSNNEVCKTCSYTKRLMEA